MLSPQYQIMEKKYLPQQNGLVPWQEQTGDNITLRGWRSPRSGKPIAHFIHGTGLCSLAYEPFLNVLAKSFDLVLYDIQGHGDSEQGERFLGWQRNAEHTRRVWQRLKRHYDNVPSVGIGHNLGGALMLMRASQHPSDFSALYLLDPLLLPRKILLMAKAEALFAYQRRLPPHVELTKRRRNGWKNATQALEYFHKWGIFNSWSDRALKAYVEHGTENTTGIQKLKCAPTFEAQILASTPERLWSSIRKLNTPTRILVGDQSYPKLQSAAQIAERKNPNIEIEATPGGHFFVQERPELIANKINQSISRLLMASRP